MLGEEHCVILLSSSSAIIQWYSGENGWYAQDHSSKNAQASKSQGENGGLMLVDLQVT